MGCSASKLEDEEAIQLCKDRRNFIKQAVEQRSRFATGHAAYVQSLRRVSHALRIYVEGDEPHDFFSDSCSTPPFTPVKRFSPEFIRIPLKSSSPKPIQCHKSTSHMVHYLRSGGNSSVSVEERPQSPEVMRINTYYSMDHYGVDGFFGMQQASPMMSSFFPSSPFNGLSHPPPSPQNPQWDFFWNPFSSLDSYDYPTHHSLDRLTSDDEMAGLRKVREEEGIPDLEEEDDDIEIEREQVGEEEEEESDDPQRPEKLQQGVKVSVNDFREPDTREYAAAINNTKLDAVQFTREPQSCAEPVRNLKNQNEVELELCSEQELMGNKKSAEEVRPGFTVYVNRRPASMTEVMTDIECQFVRICDAAHEVSELLEASRAQYSSASSELTAIKMLNPVALFRSASSRSTSSRFLLAPPSYCRDDNYDCSSEFSEDAYMISGSHQSTLDRLYAWEKKLYEEVKSGERIRIAYEKKCMQLRSQDISGDDHSTMEKTRRAMRDLHTRIKVSIHSIEAISKRIEKLRDEELQPQLVELIEGLHRMWRTMTECHRIQKQAIDGAKLLLATSKLSERPPPVIRLARSATNLESELRNWRSCLETWITAQRSYVHALAGWLIRCSPPSDPTFVGSARSPLSPPRSSGAPPIYGICIQWSKVLDSISEDQAVEGLDFFVAGIASVIAQQKEEELAVKRAAAVGKEDFESQDDFRLMKEKTAEIAIKVVCAGMSMAVSSLAQLAISFMEGCDEVLKKCEDGRKEGQGCDAVK